MSSKEKFVLQETLDEFYSITPEPVLDRQNNLLKLYKKAKKITAGKQSLTIDDQSNQINRLLISQHQNWVKKKYDKYLGVEKRAKSNIFGRL